MGLTDDKVLRLQEIISKNKRLAVAFSGGIDSTFLLHFAIETLGGENVSAYSCISAVNSAAGLANMRAVFNAHFTGKTALHEIDIYPLSWKEFVSNNENRCYFCKKRMYTTLLDEINKDDFFDLAEGTNVDDLKDNRPGLRAIRELKIKTPLVDAGLTKLEIRRIAEKIGLINHDLPSNSCLATRIKKDTAINVEFLRRIEAAEDYLRKKGFTGCRVKVDGGNAVIEIEKKDFADFMKDEVRFGVVYTFSQLGLTQVSLSLTGR